MTRAATYTLLSLDRYARIMGINPIHFSGATAGDFFPLRNSCGDIWFQHPWQWADSVSRNILAEEIRRAEEDIARELGWWVAPTWLYQEIKQWSKYHRKDSYRLWGSNVRDQNVSVKTKYAKVIAGGVRATTLVEAGATVVYSDDDSDGFYETATITVTTTETDIFELFVFSAGQSGSSTWEIRPPRSKTLSGGTATFVFWSWQMIDPSLWETFPITLDSPTAIDLSGLAEAPPVTTNVVSTVDVYRVYNDTTATATLLLWEPEPRNFIGTLNWSCSTAAQCTACNFTTQEGCLHVRDPNLGIVVPTPAIYSVANLRWERASFSECRDPDMVKLWYYAGNLDNDWKGGFSYSPLSEKWARTIAQLATARLERPFCSCGNLTALVKKWQMDAISLPNGLNVPERDLDNPFGTRYGEVLAWRQIKRTEHRTTHIGGAI